MPGRRANERNRPCAASSAKPTHPGAPAPACPRSRRPSCASSSSAQPHSARRAQRRRQARRPSAVRTSLRRRSARAGGSTRRTRPRRPVASSAGPTVGQTLEEPRPPSVVALPPMPSRLVPRPGVDAAPTSSARPDGRRAIRTRSAGATRAALKPRPFRPPPRTIRRKQPARIDHRRSGSWTRAVRDRGPPTGRLDRRPDACPRSRPRAGHHDLVVRSRPQPAIRQRLATCTDRLRSP
jgi:hypothetical protein